MYCQNINFAYLEVQALLLYSFMPPRGHNNGWKERQLRKLKESFLNLKSRLCVFSFLQWTLANFGRYMIQSGTSCANLSNGCFDFKKQQQKLIGNGVLSPFSIYVSVWLIDTMPFLTGNYNSHLLKILSCLSTN